MSAGNDPPRERPSSESPEEEPFLTRFRTAETGPLMFVRELLTSMATVAAVGLLLFAISGVWPPMVAVESGSMNPNMQKGDLVFVTEPDRFMPDYTHEDTGVVTYRTGDDEDYRTFGDYGSVVVYKNPSTFGPPIIHRARFWVNEGENWYDEADKDYIRAESCSELLNCPAPHDGFVTKGDNNPYYDQANGISSPVKPEWLVGTARVRIPYLGWIRLGFSSATAATPVVPGVASGAGASAGSGAGAGTGAGAGLGAGIPATAATSATTAPGTDSSLSTTPPNPTVSGELGDGLVSASGAVVDDARAFDTRHERRLAASSGTPVAA